MSRAAASMKSGWEALMGSVGGPEIWSVRNALSLHRQHQV
jgi:hypothetical protein